MSTVKKLTNLIFLSFLLQAPLFAEDMENRISAFEEDLLELKLVQADQGKIEISGDLSNLYQNYVYTSESNTDRKEDRFSHMSSVFRLNFNKTDNKRLKFYSTFGVNYFWNNTFLTPAPALDSLQRQVRESYPYLEKAFFDYFLYDAKFSISVGKLPTQSGPPLHYSNNLGRQGTYPALLYSVPLDGVALTMNLGKMLKTDARYVFRVIYSPQQNKTNLFASDVSGSSSLFYKLKESLGQAIHFNFETSDKVSFADYQLILQAYTANISRPQSVSGLRGLGQSKMPEGLYDNNIYELGSPDKILAQTTVAIAYFELNNLLNTKLDFYGSFKRSISKKKGSMYIVVTESVPTAPLPTTPVGTEKEVGGIIYNEDASGNSIFLGTRYQFSRSFSMGVEYIKQDYGNVPGTRRTLKLTDFYNIIGSGFHIFVNCKLTAGLNLNLGYTMADQESEIPSDGSYYISRKSKINNAYVNFRYNF